MKRFQWPLQRLLDVTVQRQRAMRAELAAVVSAIAEVQSKIDRRRELLRVLLEDLAGQDVAERITNQQVFMSFSVSCEREIERLGTKRSELESEREERRQALLNIRAECQTLEKLREEAWKQYVSEVQSEQQKELDDVVNTAYARRIMTGG
jgi:flagellar export protein FliJ